MGRVHRLAAGRGAPPPVEAVAAFLDTLKNTGTRRNYAGALECIHHHFARRLGAAGGSRQPLRHGNRYVVRLEELAVVGVSGEPLVTIQCPVALPQVVCRLEVSNLQRQCLGLQVVDGRAVL